MMTEFLLSSCVLLCQDIVIQKSTRVLQFVLLGYETSEDVIFVKSMDNVTYVAVCM